MSSGAKPAEALREAALIVVDVQRGFNDPVWGRRNNSGCEANIAALIGRWTTADSSVVFVRHDSVEPGSPLAPGTEGNAFQPYLDTDPTLVVSKTVNSAFHGEPELGPWLHRHGITSIVICGITTNHCCETTARIGANLGFEVTFVLDATYTFDRRSLDGGLISADEIARVTAANLQDEFASVTSTSAVLSDF